ncbi:hypothetical protein V1514DRAFT_329373 [Lipomyces japonicus]|uniref:uncharacterized protein n=1 Tax=Lipomyces japonicus TaxID=56871 RepID=UPI0034CF9CB3
MDEYSNADDIELEEGFIPLPQSEFIDEDLPLEPKHKIISRLWHEEVGASAHSVEGASQLERARFRELCEACRAGDLEQVDNMVLFGVDVNGIDEWDYTPLILASLCGHEAVVKYLLEHGAVCDRDTFQGERCLYGALTDNIRSLLLKFDISKAVDAIQPFAAHMTSLLTKTEPPTSDIIFTSTSTLSTSLTDYAAPRQFYLHRFILSARSKYFRENLTGRWKSKKLVKLSPSTDPRAFEIAIRYLYGQEVTFASKELNDSSIKVARRLELPFIVESLQALSSEQSFRRKREHRQEDMKHAQGDLEKFVSEEVIGKRVNVSKSAFESNKTKFQSQPIDSTADIILSVLDENDDSVIIYPTHKAMLIRSEYYLTMFSSLFAEGAYGVEYIGDQKILPIVHLSASSDVTEIVLAYLYSDRVEIPGSIALDVLYCADLLLIDKLKSLASIALTNIDNEEEADLSVGKHAAKLHADIYDILRAGWATRMDRLERFAAKYFAENLAHFIVQSDFAEIVLESAHRIRSRDETDTIELIDDIRFYLGLKFGILFEDDMNPTTGKVEEGPYRRMTVYERQYNSELDLIEGLLEKLDLDA